MKVRKGCRKSFRALARINREFRDSVRRCTKTLVVTPSPIEACPENSGSLSMHLNEVLSEEIKKRPGISELVMSEPVILDRSGRFYIFKSLSSIPWTVCTLRGQACASWLGHQFVAWNGSFCKRVLSASKESLKELNIQRFDLEESALLELGQLYPNLSVLKVEGQVYKSMSTANYWSGTSSLGPSSPQSNLSRSTDLESAVSFLESDRPDWFDGDGRCRPPTNLVSRNLPPHCGSLLHPGTTARSHV